MEQNLEQRVAQLEEKLNAATDLLHRFAAFATLVLEATNDSRESHPEAAGSVSG